MEGKYSAPEKDEILRNAFRNLQARGIASAWSRSSQPFSDLQAECFRLMEDGGFREDLRTYLRAHTTLPRAVQMLMTYVAMAATAKWQDAPDHLKPIRARGWFLGRWLPTFLILDGPIGRFLLNRDSPFASRYGTALPILTGARDFIGEKAFRALRNGFAHWGFDWEVVEGESFVVAYDWERDLPIAKLHQAEADAYHIVAFSLVEVLEGTMLRRPAMAPEEPGTPPVP